jgi:hypothetical protein
VDADPQRPSRGGALEGSNVTYTLVMLKEPAGGYSVLTPAFDDAATQGDDLGE